MVRIDENQEAVALIRMAIDDYNYSQTSEVDFEDSANKLPTEPDSESYGLSEQHWTLGSRSGTQLDSRAVEECLAPSNPNFVSFDQRLRSFIADNFPEEAPRYEDLIYVSISPFFCYVLR